MKQFRGIPVPIDPTVSNGTRANRAMEYVLSIVKNDSQFENTPEVRATLGAKLKAKILADVKNPVEFLTDLQCAIETLELFYDGAMLILAPRIMEQVREMGIFKGDPNAN